MGMINTIRQAVGLGGGAMPSRPRPRSEFFRGEGSAFLKSWRPQTREHHEDVRAAWQMSAARAVDAMQNSGFISGMIETSVASVVGTELALASRPDHVSLGWTEDRANEWAETVETAWEAWAHSPMECDAAGRMTFGQMQQLAYICWLTYGENLSLLPIMQRRRGALTKVMMLPPTRLAQKNDGQRISQGVEVDGFGMAQAYHIARRFPDTSFQSEIVIPRFDRDGREQVIHVYDASILSTRGISPLAPVLKVVRQIDQLCDATLTAALIQTIFAATIRTEFDGPEAFAGLMTEQDGKADLASFAASKGEWYDSSKINLFEHGRIGHLYPNDRLEFHNSQHPNAQYDNFIAWLLREVARCAGVTYESATGDYRSSTYSSVRMATAEIWNIVLKRRSGIVAPFSQRVFETWLEDEIGAGRIEIPGGLEAFYQNRQAYCRTRWTGPPKPQADDLKTARAQQTLLQIGVSSLETVCVEYGTDWKAEMDRRAREKAYAKKKGLPDPHPFPDNPLAKKEEQGSGDDKTDDPSYMPDA